MAHARALPLPDLLAGDAGGKRNGVWPDALKRLSRNRPAMIALFTLGAIFVLAALGNYVDVIQRYDPAALNYADGTKTGPSWDHFLGQDHLGRDTWARVLQGTWISLRVGLGVAAIALVVGVLVGGAAALTGSAGDNILMRVTDALYAFPDLLFIILLRAVLDGRDVPGGDVAIIIFTIAFVSWMTVARLVRGQMLSLARSDYVLAARALGASQTRIVFFHMLPNALGPVIVAVTFAIPVAIFAESALAFIGFGVAPPAASLGTLIDEGHRQIIETKWMLIFPGSVLAVLMLCFTFLGDGLRDALDPRSR
ncbi:MAG: ABC transporter permease [Chloroflexi bacterium]|nr:ABC transporter permease [Chloroflexota bacterium]